jgi:hypothetical protein
MVNFLGVSRPDIDAIELDVVTPIFWAGRLGPNGVEEVFPNVVEDFPNVEERAIVDSEDIPWVENEGFMDVEDLSGDIPVCFIDVEDFRGEIEVKCFIDLSGESIEVDAGGFMVAGLSGAEFTEFGTRLGMDDFLCSFGIDGFFCKVCCGTKKFCVCGELLKAKGCVYVFCEVP